MGTSLFFVLLLLNSSDLCLNGTPSLPSENFENFEFESSNVLKSNVSKTQSRKLTKNNLLSCGDVESQPGPANAARTGSGRKVTNPCAVCEKGVTKASKAISCDSCDKWTHVRCTSRVSLNEYLNYVNDGGTIDFTCDLCGWASLPFSNDDGTGFEDADSGVASAAPSQVAVGFSSCCLPSILESKGFHFLHANVRSLIPKIPEVQVLLARTKATVFAATETWLNGTVSDAEIQVPGFSVIRKDRNRNGGGVCLYIRNDVAFNPRPDLSVDGMEAVWVEILIPRSKGILVCSCYRPPSDGNFLSKLEVSLSRIDPSSELYILGDLNIDLGNTETFLSKSLLGILNLFGLSQVIVEPTRVTPTSSSILDHIVVSMTDKVRSSGVICVGFSDHLVTYCSRGLTNLSSIANVRKVRCFRNYTPFKLKEALKALDWSVLLLSTDVNFCLDKFVDMFKVALDTVAPIRHVRMKSKSNSWMNPHILAGIKLRDSLLSRFRKNRGDKSLYSEYCKVRNSVQRDIKSAKESFFCKTIEKSRGDSGKLWRHLKSLGYKNSSSSSPIVLENNGTKVFDKAAVACLFNRFYTTVASNLLSKLPSPTGLFHTSSQVFRQFYCRIVSPTSPFVLSPVSQHFIRKQLRGLNPNKAVGLDGISSKFLRDSADVITQPICHMINISILTETVPSGFKQAKVVPLFKKGSRLDPGNYRPVSVLSVLSKILERAVDFQLKEYLERKHVLYGKQSGFRSRFSTDTCLIGLTDFVKREMAQGNCVGMVLLDLQKAFDTVNHDILLSKMTAIGVTSISWFKSYLSCREQCVEIDGILSDFLPVTCGVPQGSILGPQLFLLYINDLSISINCDLSLYADDSALIFSDKDPNSIASHLSTQLDNCKEWMTENRLSLHVGKTESILFGSSRKLRMAGDFQVACEGVPVKRVSCVKYLGVMLDENLSGKPHAENLIKKCGSRVSFLYRKAPLLSTKTRITLCSALIQPFLDYCCSSWYSGLTQKFKSRLDVIQR